MVMFGDFSLKMESEVFSDMLSMDFIQCAKLSTELVIIHGLSVSVCSLVDLSVSD